MSGKILVDVVYALAARQAVRRLELDASSTVGDAIAASGFRELFPEVELASAPVGIFGRIVRPETRLTHGDQVEIYRPLTADPREARKRRASRLLRA